METAATMTGPRLVLLFYCFSANQAATTTSSGSLNSSRVTQLFVPQSSESSDLSDGPITVQEFMEVKSALTASEAKIQQLLKVNCHLSEELRMMQSKVCKLTSSL